MGWFNPAAFIQDSIKNVSSAVSSLSYVFKNPIVSTVANFVPGGGAIVNALNTANNIVNPPSTDLKNTVSTANLKINTLNKSSYTSTDKYKSMSNAKQLNSRDSISNIINKDLIINDIKSNSKQADTKIEISKEKLLIFGSVALAIYFIKRK